MARGLPDAGNVVKGKDITSLDDMAELAVRLGSPMGYIRGGDVLFLDGFERGLSSWILDENGAGAEIILSTDKSFQGDLSCLLDSGLNPGPWASITKLLPPVTDQRIAMQTCFDVKDTTKWLDFFLGYYDGDWLHTWGIRYEHASGKLYYAFPAGNWTLLSTPGKLYDDDGNFHHVKLIVDLDTKSYVRCFLNRTEYPMADLPCWQGLSVLSPMLYVQIKATGDGLNATKCYLDNVIVTSNET